MSASLARTVPFLIAALIASLARGQAPPPQTPLRVFTVKHAETQRDFEEIVSSVTRMAGIDPASTDTTQRTFTVHGTIDQIALAEWLVNELDAPVNPTLDPQPGQGSPHEYRPSDGTQDVLRVFYLAHTKTAQDLQYITTALRTVTRIRQVATYVARSAMSVRGTPAQIALAAWLVNCLDTPDNWLTSDHRTPVPATHEYRPSDGTHDVARVFFLTHAATVRDLQEIYTAIRAITDTTYTYFVPAPRAIVMRGQARNAAMAEWLFNELNRANNWEPLAQRQPDWDTHQFQISDELDGATELRVFYIPPTAPARELEHLFYLIRRKVGMPRMLPCTTPRALPMRGTPEQIALVGKLITERLK